MKNSVLAFAVLIGTVVGAGIFGLPYVVSKSGLVISLFYFLVLGWVAVSIHLFLGEVCLRTEGEQRIVNYAQRYLGKWGRLTVALAVIVGLTGSLLAYGIIGGDFLKIIFGSVGLSAFSLAIIFMALLSFFVIRGVKTIAPAEIFTNIIFFAIILTILFLGLSKINLQNFSLINTKGIFLPFGVIMFAIIGWTAIPEMLDILKRPAEKRNLKNIIIYGTFFCVLLYIIFSFVVFGISGSHTSSETLQGLAPFLGSRVIFFGALAAVITLADSYLIIGLSLKNTLRYDFGMPNLAAAAVSCGLPIILYIAGLRGFIGTIGFMGTILGLVIGVAIVLIFLKAKQKSDRTPEYNLKIPQPLIYILIAILILGAVFQIAA